MTAHAPAADRTAGARLLDRLATGAWLDRTLVRAASVLCLAWTIAALLFLLGTGSGTLDGFGRPIGTDFSNVWTAGTMALEGRAAAAYDWASHHQVQQAAHGSEAVPFYGWHYPPPFLLLAAALATMPYLVALAVWQATTLAAAVAMAHRILPRRDTLLVAAGFPAVFVCVMHGHNGFLSAVLLAGGLLVLDRRPVVAGICFGLLSYKPQLGLVLPFALAAGGYWRAIAAAALTVAALALASTLAFGTEIWPAFLASAEPTQRIVLEAGNTGWEKIQSAFAAARMWGAPVGLAHLVQAAVTLAVIAAVVKLWRARAPFEVRAAATMAGALLATPYLLDYDLVVLGPALALLVARGLRNGFRRWEVTLLALAWIAPLATRSVAAVTGIPLGLGVLVVVFGIACRDGFAGEGRVPAPFLAPVQP